MSDARIGSDVAGFRIVSVLGQGGMGTVYVAEQSSPRRKVALKLLRPDLSTDEAFQRRFAHESEAAASTEHPNIVPIYSSGEADGVLYIAMRYVDGTDLRERIAKAGAVPLEQAVDIVSQVAGALDAAHRRGLVHRDVKPGNILLDDHGNAYLTDFGLIKRSEVSTGITKTGQFMGSIEYCAPEQIRGEEIDGRADVYSLGCVLYECLAGRPPFKRDTEIATLYAHLEQPPPSLPTPSGAAPGLDRVLARAMAKRPSDRYATAGELARAARHAAGVTSGERETVEPRRRGLVILAAVLAVAAVSVIGLVLLRSDSTETGPRATSRSVTGNASVVRLDSESGEVAQTVGGFTLSEAAFFAPGLAVGEGGVWVGAAPDVLHVDPVTGTIRATIALPRSASTLPAVGFRTVWVSTGSTLQRINPATDELLRPIDVAPPRENLFGTPFIATGQGAVWTATETTLTKVDPVQSRVVGRFPVEGATGLAVGEGAVWVIDNLSGELVRIDPRTGEQTGAVNLSGSLDDIAVGGGVVWVLDKDAGTVALVDPAALSVQDSIRVGADERDLTFGDGAAWLADGGDNSITRIDPLTHEPRAFPVGDPAVLVALDPVSGAVWTVTSSAG